MHHSYKKFFIILYSLASNWKVKINQKAALNHVNTEGFRIPVADEQNSWMLKAWCRICWVYSCCLFLVGFTVFSLYVFFRLGNSNLFSQFLTLFVKLMTPPLQTSTFFAHMHLLVLSAIYAHKCEGCSGAVCLGQADSELSKAPLR